MRVCSSWEREILRWRKVHELKPLGHYDGYLYVHSMSEIYIKSRYFYTNMMMIKISVYPVKFGLLNNTEIMTL